MEQQEHKRRIRYKGTHPKSYGERYKELQPEKYADTVDKVIRKGSTPVGMHISICVREILDFLQIKPGQTGLDCTLGYGGHTLEMLKCLEHSGHLYALDVDQIELAKTRERLAKLGYGSDQLTVKPMNFADIDQVSLEVGLFDFVLADLGISSMQISNPDRGFSYKTEGPLDLRLNQEKGITAAERLKQMTKAELTGMLIENADEPYAEVIASAVIKELKKGTDLSTTTALKHLIETALLTIPADKTPDLTKAQIEAFKKERAKKSCQRTFQALRIDVNNEYEVLEQFLEKLPNILAPGGRAAILTFHSGEDRLVKKISKRLLSEGIYQEISTKVIRPSAEECMRNSRARSTKLRWVIKS